MDENKPPCPFGEILVNARKERDISQYQLAKLIGRNSRQLAKIEKGKNEPRLSTIILLAKALDMDVYDLIRETVEKMQQS